MPTKFERTTVSPLKASKDIHKLALQMGTSVAMLEKFYSKVSPRMNAAEHAGIKNKRFE